MGKGFLTGRFDENAKFDSPDFRSTLSKTKIGILDSGLMGDACRAPGAVRPERDIIMA